jgi:phage/plasmid-associated DNA primase
MKMLHWRAVAGMVVKLLSITGEDKIDVAQKYQRSANSRLSTRLVIMSNETLNLQDETGVVATRFICLEMIVSWLDREDVFLFEKLEKELPGIFNKALAALDAARDRGRLTQPKSGAKLAEELLRGTDTLIRWMLDNTVKDSGEQTSVDMLYLNYRGWMQGMEFKFFERKDRFSERLQGFPGVEAGGRTPRSEGRTRTLRGIRLKDYKDRAREAGVELKKCEPEPPRPDRRAREIAQNEAEAQAQGVTLVVMEEHDGVITFRPAKPGEAGLWPHQRFVIEANMAAAKAQGAAQSEAPFRRRF